MRKTIEVTAEDWGPIGRTLPRAVRTEVVRDPDGTFTCPAELAGEVRQAIADFTPAVVLANAKTMAIAEVTEFVANARMALSGAQDHAKLAIYNQRAAYARQIKAGTASPAMEAVAKSEAVRTGLAVDLATADAEAMADIWIAKDERLAALAAEVDALETQTIAAIQAAGDADAIDTVLADALAIATARIAEETGDQA